MSQTSAGNLLGLGAGHIQLESRSGGVTGTGWLSVPEMLVTQLHSKLTPPPLCDKGTRLTVRGNYLLFITKQEEYTSVQRFSNSLKYFTNEFNFTLHEESISLLGILIENNFVVGGGGFVRQGFSA